MRIFCAKTADILKTESAIATTFLLFFYIDLVGVTVEYENFYYCCWTTKHQCHRKDNAIKVYIQLVLLFKEANCIARFQSNMTGLTTCCFEDNIKVLWWQLLQYMKWIDFSTIIKLRCSFFHFLQIRLCEEFWQQKFQEDEIWPFIEMVRS